jgi:hypothetical protein
VSFQIIDLKEFRTQNVYKDSFKLMFTIQKIAGFCAGFALITATLSASSVTFSTPSGSQAGGENVSATATFTITSGNLDITLQNTASSITDAGQVLSGLQFALSSGGTASLSSSSGQEVTIASTGTPTLGSIGSTGWGFGTKGSSFIVCDICTSGVTFSTNPTVTPSNTIIPTETSYSSANGSIKGNGAHNPFLEGAVTFDIADSAITANTTISDLIFSFSTTAGNDVTGTVLTPSVPEPVSMALTAAGFFALAGFLKIRRRRELGHTQA